LFEQKREKTEEVQQKKTVTEVRGQSIQEHNSKARA
jgi:hypothetical protein